MNNQKLISRREFVAATSAALCCVTIPVEVRAAEPGSGFQLGCYTRPWDQWEYRVALDGVAEAGFKYVGIMTAKGKTWVILNPESTPEEAQEIAGESSKRGLKILSIYGGDFPVKRSVQEGIDGLKKLIDISSICGCPNLLLGGTTDDKLFEPYYQVVKECCPYARTKKVGLSIKPHGGQNSTGPQCRAIIERVGSADFRLWYDPGNIFYYSDGKLDPVDDAPKVDGLVVGMSVKDFLPPKEVLVTPGTGKVNFDEVVSRLKKGGFRAGPMLIECLAKRDTPAAVTAEAKKARTFLENLPPIKV
jgi:sugar phosphate isomerase/epimerase